MPGQKRYLAPAADAPALAYTGFSARFPMICSQACKVLSQHQHYPLKIIMKTSLSQLNLRAALCGSLLAAVPVSAVCTITLQPQSRSLCDGERLSLSVMADTGGVPAKFQWRLDGTPIPGATSSSFSATFEAEGPPAAGETGPGIYDCVVTCGPESATSSGAVVRSSRHEFGPWRVSNARWPLDSTPPAADLLNAPPGLTVLRTGSGCDGGLLTLSQETQVQLSSSTHWGIRLGLPAGGRDVAALYLTGPCRPPYLCDFFTATPAFFDATSPGTPVTVEWLDGSTVLRTIECPLDACYAQWTGQAPARFGWDLKKGTKRSAVTVEMASSRAVTVAGVTQTATACRFSRESDVLGGVMEQRINIAAGDVNGDGISQAAAAQDYNSSRSNRSRAGIATGDTTGDTVDLLITGSESVGAPHVKFSSFQGRYHEWTWNDCPAPRKATDGTVASMLHSSGSSSEPLITLRPAAGSPECGFDLPDICARSANWSFGAAQLGTPGAAREAQLRATATFSDGRSPDIISTLSRAAGSTELSCSIFLNGLPPGMPPVYWQVLHQGSIVLDRVPQAGRIAFTEPAVMAQACTMALRESSDGAALECIWRAGLNGLPQGTPVRVSIPGLPDALHTGDEVRCVIPLGSESMPAITACGLRCRGIAQCSILAEEIGHRTALWGDAGILTFPGTAARNAIKTKGTGASGRTGGAAAASYAATGRMEKTIMGTPGRPSALVDVNVCMLPEARRGAIPTDGLTAAAIAGTATGPEDRSILLQPVSGQPGGPVAACLACPDTPACSAGISVDEPGTPGTGSASVQVQGRVRMRLILSADSVMQPGLAVTVVKQSQSTDFGQLVCDASGLGGTGVTATLLDATGAVLRSGPISSSPSGGGPHIRLRQKDATFTSWSFGATNAGSVMLLDSLESLAVSYVDGGGNESDAPGCTAIALTCILPPGAAITACTGIDVSGSGWDAVRCDWFDCLLPSRGSADQITTSGGAAGLVGPRGGVCDDNVFRFSIGEPGVQLTGGPPASFSIGEPGVQVAAPISSSGGSAEISVGEAAACAVSLEPVSIPGDSAGSSSAAFRIRVIGPDMEPDLGDYATIFLNGLPPGQPDLRGRITLQWPTTDTTSQRRILFCQNGVVTAETHVHGDPHVDFAERPARIICAATHLRAPAATGQHIRRIRSAAAVRTPSPVEFQIDFAAPGTVTVGGVPRVCDSIIIWRENDALRCVDIASCRLTGAGVPMVSGAVQALSCAPQIRSGLASSPGGGLPVVRLHYSGPGTQLASSSDGMLWLPVEVPGSAYDASRGDSAWQLDLPTTASRQFYKAASAPMTATWDTARNKKL